MKDKGEIYILVGEFDEYSARTLQVILASFDRDRLETLRDELQKKAEAIQEKYSEILHTSNLTDVHKSALVELDREARAVNAKFNFRDHVEFTVETVEFLNPEKEAKNGD